MSSTDFLLPSSTIPEESKKVVRLLATRHAGFTREEISKATGIPLGGGLTNTLAALVESDFIKRYHPYGKAKSVECYKLMDNFCLFWLKYVKAMHVMQVLPMIT